MTIKYLTKTKIGFAFLAITALIGASCSAPDKSPTILQIDQQKQVEDVVVTINQVRLSDEEILVLYEVTGPDDVYREGPLRSPTIEYGDQTLRSGAKPDVDGLLVLSFPPLPEGTNEFTINIPPYWQLNGPAANFSISLGDRVGTTLPPPEGRELQMDQLIEVGSVQFRLTSFILRPDSFEFTYKPEPGSETTGLLLAGPGPIFENISATDDSGHSYRAGGGGTFLNFVEGHPQLKSQTIEFDSALQPGSTRLDVRIEATGTIGPEPFRFQIPLEE